MLSTDWDVEASLTFDEPRNAVTEITRDSIQPRGASGPFLLVGRTGRVVTAHADTIGRGSDMASTAGYSGVPANSRVCSSGSPRWSRN